ncbi:ankyrin repeat domain-containing protein [Muribacter muris]|uniref:Ankyrin repeat domain-containing protein n=1 Tax=Muribacter muris TaxID=67855 RepID=A0A4Y9JP83_9PAST|nr:ankyrin repeat domain-containing protein [Muribacter muris]MBF0786256.1 ankyrin repeat domain-containing protein [Muribacter muris]MBF0826434.1 ankyrin repeat domain-containing protein [Muribacter muris]TFV07378.1 ankyrin repeat domain-containing protein [Muribacter muris]
MDKKLELGIKILDAIDTDSFDTLEKIFQNSDRSILEITELEHWNWLHKALLGFDSEVPSSKAINYLIDKGINVNAQDIYGMTPLHYAMRGKNIDAAIALLNAGADPNIPNIDNLIPLRMCIRYPDRLDLLELMLKNGGDVHYFNGEDYLLEGLKDFKGDDPNYSAFFEMMEQYA